MAEFISFFGSSVSLGSAVSWAFFGGMVAVFMIWPLVLVLTPLQDRREGRIVVVYSVATFLAGSIFYASMIAPQLAYETARQLYFIYMILMGGLCVKGVFEAFGGVDAVPRLFAHQQPQHLQLDERPV